MFFKHQKKIRDNSYRISIIISLRKLNQLPKKPTYNKQVVSFSLASQFIRLYEAQRFKKENIVKF